MASQEWRDNNREYLRTYSRKWYAKNKEKQKQHVKNRKLKTKEFITKIKRNSFCYKCGEDDWRCLEFHHIDSSKKTANISQIWHHSWSIVRIRKELKNCVIMCANCHKKETYKNLR